MHNSKLKTFLAALVELGHADGVPNDVLAARASSAIRGGAAAAFAAFGAIAEGASGSDVAEAFKAAGLALGELDVDALNHLRAALVAPPTPAPTAS